MSRTAAPRASPAGQRAPGAFSMMLILGGLLASAVALTILYRELSIRTIIEFGEQSNASIAHATVDAVYPELVEFLGNAPGPESAAQASLPEGLLRVIEGTPRRTPIERIKIYNAHGIILHSSLAHEVGTDDSANPRFQQAMQGQPRSRLQYHDAFDIFAPSSLDDNLVETYVPIYQPGQLKPIGVFEIYSDANAMVRTMNRNELLILSGVGFVMIVLYGLLVWAMRRSERIIAAQGATIAERNQTLEMVLARTVAADEAERRRVAMELHEDIAQDLSAAKFKLEAASARAPGMPENPGGVASDEVILLLQHVIRDVRDLASDLRPLSIDDFGLVASTLMLCRRIEEEVTGLRIRVEIGVSEQDVPDALKVVILRIVQQSLQLLSRQPAVEQIHLSLSRSAGLELVMEFSCAAGAADSVVGAGTLVQVPYVAAPWSRAVLSGAAVRMARVEGGSCRCRALWAV